jgi:hypothetical protein
LTVLWNISIYKLINHFPHVFKPFNRVSCTSNCCGFGALAPTLGTLIPVIGASGFAAAAGAAGTVAGSVAVAASFGGMDM